jgi:predicted transposase YdaD
MSRLPLSPHDAYFREVMGRPVDAASHLRTVVPKALVPWVEWDSLELQPGSFVTGELRGRHTDLLYKVRLLHDNGGPHSTEHGEAFIFALVEHQTVVDALMAFRVLEYIVAIYRRYLRDNPGIRTLPPVIPVVVHVGRDGRWTAPTQIADLIDLDANLRDPLREYLPRLRFLLDDLGAPEAAAIAARPLTPAVRVMLTVQRVAVRKGPLAALLATLVDDLAAILARPGGREDFECLLTYIFTVGDNEPDKLTSIIDQLGPTAKEAIMTTAERLAAEGLARGMAEGKARGMAEGKARGMAEGKAEALLDLLEAKFGRTPAEFVDQVKTAASTQVDSWIRRVLTATSIDEVFAH